MAIPTVGDLSQNGNRGPECGTPGGRAGRVGALISGMGSRRRTRDRSGGARDSRTWTTGGKKGNWLYHLQGLRESSRTGIVLDTTVLLITAI